MNKRIINKEEAAKIENVAGQFRVVADREDYSDGSYRLTVVAENLPDIHEAALKRANWNNARRLEK